MTARASGHGNRKRAVLRVVLRFRRPGHLPAQVLGFAAPPRDGCAFSLRPVDFSGLRFASGAWGDQWLYSSGAMGTPGGRQVQSGAVPIGRWRFGEVVSARHLCARSSRCYRTVIRRRLPKPSCYGRGAKPAPPGRTPRPPTAAPLPPARRHRRSPCRRGRRQTIRACRSPAALRRSARTDLRPRRQSRARTCRRRPARSARRARRDRARAPTAIIACEISHGGESRLPGSMCPG
jgi:hypothetical protein